MRESGFQSVVDDATERDPNSAVAEYGAEFRADTESYIAQAVEACASAGLRERSPLPGIQYRAFVDPSGGSSDSMTLAIGNIEKEVAIVDVVRQIKAPFGPEAAVEER
ncbi:MAG: hypothetical protein JWM58_2241 [Rhizobium sp.]|nr:hypothetical protein [Rhizobium sp.]